MKISAADFERMREHCALIMARDTYPAVVANYAARGLSHKRLRWDVLHASKFPITGLYSYLNDDHIDTALRAIVPGARHDDTGLPEPGSWGASVLSAGAL